MDISAIILSFFVISGLVTAGIALVRNQFVYRIQIQIIDDAFELAGKEIDRCYSEGRGHEYDENLQYKYVDQYLSYNEMMHPKTWHIWNLEGLRRQTDTA